MKPKTMILMVVAVGCGLGASYMTSRLLADRNKETPAVETVPVLVAKKRVNAWQAIKEPEKEFDIKDYPKDVAPKNPIGTYEEIKDQKIKAFLDEGTPLKKEDLVTANMKDFENLLQPGQRAIAIKVNTEMLGGGYIKPMNRVDVFCTTRGNDAATKLILQNMLVLAIDQIDDTNKNPDVRTILGSTATLAATLEESGRLALASTLGELRLLPRRADDVEQLASGMTIKAADLDKPLSTAKDDKDKKDDSQKQSPVGTEKVEKVETPILPPEEKEPEPPKKEPEQPKKPRENDPEENEPKRTQREPKTDEPRRVKAEEPKKPAEVEEEEPPAPRPKIVLNAKREPKTHTMYVRNGGKTEVKQIDTVRKDETTEAAEEESETPTPAPAKKEEKPTAAPKPEAKQTPPNNGSPTKVSRTRTPAN